MPAPARCLFTVPAAALLLLAAAPGQKKHESPEQGFRITVPRGMAAVPTEPNERQILVKFTGKIDFKGNRVYRGQDECSVLVVRIGKSKGPTTGGDKAGEEEEGEKSLREHAIEALNGGTNLKEFLDKRGYKDDLVEVALPKPLKAKSGESFAMQQVLGDGFDRTGEPVRVAVIRAYLMEDATEYFGVVGLGPCLPPFDDILADAAKSLERIAVGTSKGAVDYDKTGLENVDFREGVRKKLVKGWRAYDTEHFIFVTNTKDEKVIENMLADLELMRKVYQERFPPVEEVKAISTVRFCATHDDYMAYGAQPGTAGYWNFIDEELVLTDVRTLGKEVLQRNPNLKNMSPEDVLYHEAMHQYFYYANGQLSPASWFNEGYGEYFGGSVPDRRKGEVARIDRNRFRMAWIKRSQGLKSWPDLRTFLKMTQPEFYDPRSSLQNYAFAWAFCFFLEEQRKDPKGNKAWGAIPDLYLKNLRELTEKKREEIGAEKTDKNWMKVFEMEIQRACFEATFAGIDLLEIEKAWIAAMKRWK